MQLPSFPVFHPQGQFAVIVQDQSIALHSVSSDGSIPTQPIQRVDAAALAASVSMRTVNGGVWNPQGTVVAFSGADELIAGLPGGVLFFGFDGRLSNLSGSPLPAGFLPSLPILSSDGFAYTVQAGSGPSPGTIVSYRVSASGASIAGSVTLPGVNTYLPLLLDGERTLAVHDAMYARQADGTLVERSRLTRNTRNSGVSPYYTLRNSDFRVLTDNTVVYSAVRNETSAPSTSVFFIESAAGSRPTPMSGDVSLGNNERVMAVAQGGRVLLTKTLDGAIRSWPVDADGRPGPVRSAVETSIIGDPRVVVNPAGTTAYFFWREVPGIVAVRVAADGLLARFDPLPAGTRFQTSDAANRILFNVR